MPAHGPLWAVSSRLPDQHQRHRRQFQLRAGTDRLRDRRFGRKASSMGGPVVAVRSYRLGCMSLLYTTLAGPSPYPTHAHGPGSARKRQSQTEKRPKLEFRGPLNSPVFRPFSTKSALNSAWRPKLNKLGACDVEGLSRHCRHGRRELGGAAGGAHVLSTPVPEFASI